MARCENCESAIFCDTWGEYKCLKKLRRVRDGEADNCADYKKRKDEMPDCQCEDCMNRGDIG